MFQCKMRYEYFEDKECWYCHTRGIGLQKHHLWRGAYRKKSLTVWLCYKCHEKATFNKWFEEHLQEIYLEMENKPKPKWKSH